MFSTRAFSPGLLRAGVCVLLALSLIVPLPLLPLEPAHAKSSMASTQQLTSLNGRQVHVLASASPSPKADPPSIAPVPLPGGDVVPPLGLIHVFFPGPTSIGDDGIDIEPSTITNFKGFTGVAMLAGTATDGNGNQFSLATDIRVFQGEYESADGQRRHGTFVLI